MSLLNITDPEGNWSRTIPVIRKIKDVERRLRAGREYWWIIGDRGNRYAILTDASGKQEAATGRATSAAEKSLRSNGWETSLDNAFEYPVLQWYPNTTGEGEAE